jgi:hypothetical protein
MNLKRRLEGLEERHRAKTAPPEREAPEEPALGLYFKVLENERREQAGEPPIPLTLEEKRLEHERDNDPEFRAYMERISEQREERIWREET